MRNHIFLNKKIYTKKIRSENFQNHVEKACEIIKSWPKWKKDFFGLEQKGNDPDLDEELVSKTSGA